MILKAVTDPHPFKFWLWARQWGKTTEIGSDLAFNATTKPNFDQTYFNFSDAALKTFTENKFRQDVFGHEPLSKFISGFSKLGSQKRIVLKTPAIIDMLLPGENWANAQGKSNKKMVIDEGNDIDWSGFNNARQTQADTMGDTLIAGIGGFEETDYQKLWLTTNQMEYDFRRGENYQGYSNNSWRADLEFNGEGLVEDEYLLDVLDGDWNPRAPKNYSRHGYHLSQVQNPRIPITIDDAITKYKVNPEFSLEWQIKADPFYDPLEFARNNLALFVQGTQKPFTTAQLMKLVDRNLDFTPSDKVDHDLGPVFVGVDWGGGPKTIVWVWQLINDLGPVFKMLFAAKLEGQDQDEQYHTVRDVIEAYDATQAVVDSGGGTHQVEQLQKYFGPRCLRCKYLTAPEKPRPTPKEMIELRKRNLYTVDRTYALDGIKNLVDIPFTDFEVQIPRIIIPGENMKKVQWIFDQFTNEEIELITIGTSRQQYRRYYTPDLKVKPDDALHAANYARIAWMIKSGRATGHAGGPIHEKEDLDV